MNIQEYIESGIIETYVLGLASPSESAEFERLCAQHPELVAARRKFEEGLEKHASTHGVQPPVGVKVKVLEAIGDTVAGGARENVSLNPPKIVTMQNESKKGSSGLRFVAAASVVLLIGLAWFSYQFYTQNAELERSNTALKDKLNSTDSTLNKILEETREAVKNPNTTVVNMVGTKVAPKSSANIYWDSTNSSVYLVVKNMPKLPTDKQYQLWALIDGKPKDLGVFDATDDKVILKMKNTQKAQAFAITIEKTGGSPSPTLDSMQSLGKTLQNQ